MNDFAPKYYKKFKCISSLCSHSCCIGWEIDVDKNTLNNYNKLSNPYKKEILESIKLKPTPHFKLKRKGLCPHLDDNGLCKIITNCGEELLCDICREHPRFYNYTPFGIEVGIGMSCEEACRLILSSNDYDCFIKVAEEDGEVNSSDFNPLEYREKIFATLKNSKLSYKEKLTTLQNEYDVSPQIVQDKEWRSKLKNLEYLTRVHKKLFSVYTSSLDNTLDESVYLERAVAYFIFRHLTKAESKEEMKSYLGLCLFLERLLNSILVSNNAHELNQIISYAVALSEEIEYCEDNLDTLRFEFV